MEIMRKLIPFAMLLMAAPAHADITHKISSSVQLSVEGPAVQSTRVGSSYSVSGDNIAVTTLGGLTGSSATAPATINAGSYAINNDGQAFSFSENQLIGDTVVTTQTALSSGQIDTANLYSNTTTQVGGTAGALAGTIDTAGTITLTAGGAGTTATGQFVSDITVR